MSSEVRFNCSTYFVEDGPYVARVPDKCYLSNTLVSSYSFTGKLGKARLCKDITSEVIDPNCSKYFAEDGPYVVRVPDKCYLSNTLISSYSFTGKLGKVRL